MDRNLPWFKMAAVNVLSDENLSQMSDAELGVYLRLLSRQWLNGSIPADPAKIARLLGKNEQDFLTIWINIETCFKPLDDDPTRLIIPEYHDQKTGALAAYQRRANAGRKGGQVSPGGGKEQALLKPGSTNPQENRIDKIRGEEEEPPRPPQGGENEVQAETKPEGMENPTGADEPRTGNGKPPQEAQNRTAKQKRPKPVLIRIPEDFKPTEASLKWLRDKYGNIPQREIDFQTEQFINHHSGKGRPFEKWQKVWMTWINNWKNDFGRNIQAGANGDSSERPRGVPEHDPNLVRHDDDGDEKPTAHGVG